MTHHRSGLVAVHPVAVVTGVTAGVAAASPPSPPVPAHAIAISSTTMLAPAPGHHGFTVTRHNPDGSKLVMTVFHAASGGTRAVAYRQTEDRARGIKTRLYADGRSLTTGPGFVTRAAPGRPSFTTHEDGSREARLANGTKWFTESKIHLAAADGTQQEALRRTVYAGKVGGMPVSAAHPIVQTYVVTHLHNVVVNVYQPVIFPAPLAAWLVTGFAPPILVTPGCAFCPPPLAAFDDPAAQYTAPVDLLADEQIDGALQDGMAPLDGAPADDPGSAMDQTGGAGGAADAGAVAAQLASMRQEVADAVASNADLQAQLHDQSIEMADLQSAEAAPPAPAARAAAAAPVHVSRDVHEQVKREVSDVIAAHVTASPLQLASIMASADAEHYVFQVADLIDATDATSGEPCTLTGGDLITFSEVPGADDTTAKMKVVSGKADSCKPTAVVALSLADMQDMLNDFSQRVESNGTKMHQMLAAADTP